MEELFCGLWHFLSDDWMVTATLFTTIITLFTLKTLIKQRKDAIRPLIVYENILHFSLDYTVGISTFKTWWRTSNSQNIENATFLINNPTNNVALELTIKEDFDLVKMIQKIEAIDFNNVFSFYINPNGTIKIKSVVLEYDYVTNRIIDKVRNLGVILPCERHNSPRYAFDENYLLFLSFYNYLIESDERNKYLFGSELPPLKMKTTFKDIDGTKYFYRINVTPFYTNSSLITMQFAHKRLKFRELIAKFFAFNFF